MPDGSDIHIPFAVVAGVVAPMAGAVAYMFKQLLRANADRQAEMARVTEGLASEMKEQWRFVERMNHIRVLEIAAFPHVAPQIRDDANKVCKEIEEAEAEAKRKEKR